MSLLENNIQKYSPCTHDTLLYIQQHPEAKAILHLAMRDGRNSLFTKNCPTRPEILRGSDVLFRWCDAIKNLGVGKRAREKFRDEATASLVKTALQILVTELWCPMSASVHQLRAAINGGYRNGKGVLTSALKQARFVITELREDLRISFEELRIPYSPLIVQLTPSISSSSAITSTVGGLIRSADPPSERGDDRGHDQDLYSGGNISHSGSHHSMPLSMTSLPPDFTVWSRLELGSHKELTPTSTPFCISSPPLLSLLPQPAMPLTPYDSSALTNNSSSASSSSILPLPSMSSIDSRRDHDSLLPSTPPALMHFHLPAPPGPGPAPSVMKIVTEPTQAELNEEKDIATLLLLMKELPNHHPPPPPAPPPTPQSQPVSVSSSPLTFTSSLGDHINRVRSHSRTSSFGGKNKRTDDLFGGATTGYGYGYSYGNTNGVDTDGLVNETEDDDDGDLESRVNENYVTCGSCPYLLESSPSSASSASATSSEAGAACGCQSESEVYESFISLMIHGGYATHLLTADPLRLDEWISRVILLMNYELVASDDPVLYHRADTTTTLSQAHSNRRLRFHLIQSSTPSTPHNSTSSAHHMSPPGTSSDDSLRICYGDYDANDILFPRPLALAILEKLRRCGEIEGGDPCDDFISNKRFRCE
jgi:hypothetical protein